MVGTRDTSVVLLCVLPVTGSRAVCRALVILRSVRPMGAVEEPPQRYNYTRDIHRCTD